MRAGLGHPSDSAELPAGVEDVARRMMALAVSMVGRAGENAAVYALHAGRKSVATHDVNRALQYQAKTFLATVTEDEVVDAMADVERACEEEEDSDTEEEDDDAEEEAGGGDKEEEEKEWTASVCPCEICAGMNEAHDTWDSYNPEDEALAYLKNLTSSILATHQQ